MELPPARLELEVLRALAAQGLEGRELAVHIERRSGGALRVGYDALHPTLHRLEQWGWIAVTWGSSPETGRRVRRYTLAAAGRRRVHLLAGREALASVWRRLTGRGSAGQTAAAEREPPGEESLARLRAPQARRGESFWGSRPGPGLAARVLDAMKHRVSHTELERPPDLVAPPAAPRPARGKVVRLTGTAAGKRASQAMLVVLAAALACAGWLRPRAALSALVLPVGAYLAWDVLLSCAVWVRINSRRPPPGWPAERRRTLTPWVLSARHAALFFVHKLNYLLHLMGTFVYLLFLRNRWVPRATDEEIADHCVEIVTGSSFAIFLRQPEGQAGGDVFVLDLRQQAISHEIGKFDNRLLVTVDAARRQVLRFEWNEAPVVRNSERLQILCDVGSQSIHPMIHSFNPILYDAASTADRKYDRIFRHGQNLNDAAHHYPALCLLSPPRWFKTVLETNAAAAIPFHSAATLQALAPHSAYVRFMLPARAAYRRLVEKHAVGVDAEAFFICSALHSVDHAVYGALQDRVDFPGAGNNLVYRWFHLPVSVDAFMDNTLAGNRAETPLYAELYEELRALDPAYADMIELSISN